MALAASAGPVHFGRASFTLQNGKDALALNQKFATLNANSPCTAGENACIGTQFAQCVNGKFVTTPCAGGLTCAALPLVNSPGTSITCTTSADRDARIAATGATRRRRDDEQNGPEALRAKKGAAGAGGRGANRGGKGGKGGKGAAASQAASKTTAAASTNAAAAASAAGSSAVASSAAATSTASAGDNAANGTAAAGTQAGSDGGDPQKSLTLLQSVIATGFANDGQDQPEAGQVPSLTSTNNFINFCATVSDKKITNGQQIKEGSCNPAPMGVIAATTNMPSSKFVFPTNNGKVPANQNFTVKMAIKNLETGNFVNANANYFSAPQQVNAQGNIKGHSHIVIEQLPAIDSTAPTDPTNFAFFKGLNAKDQGGVLSADVAGLPAGVYRMASINTAANHQPALVAVAQHGSLDDMIYFTVA
ncbi:hypothetical protein L227DRAFT_616589 [Lentinus tigrinus ALCF2SS1-6]|uniref:Carbohydrate-binding module family 19 domain-containing protein n=1 Tax=Lentinus tigrinus ALCF2SS1-6 TaxID=1328759 RepID=A0A5C2RQJ4_9APHY|nr:hypothetical protein L227DRAFT_616589 [Lentinus tigrinus ALCF2SS1-6]